MYRGLPISGSSAGSAVGTARLSEPMPDRVVQSSPLQGSMNVEFTQISDLGKVRQGNEDYAGHAAPEGPDRVRSHGWLFVLADGVGGHDFGEIASRTAVETVLAGFQKSPAGEAHGPLLGRLVQSANKHVIDVGHDSGHTGASMATTIVVCALRYDRAAIAHVGDSRCYLIRRSQA